MNIDSISNGVVLDHIQAGRSMEIYKHLNLDQLDCQVAIIKNARSGLYRRQHHRQHHPGRETEREKASGAAPETGECHPVQEPPVHHHGGAPAGRRVSAQ